MESKKVKEIKKALKKNIRLGLSYEDKENYCKVWLADILTLINELECENERLRNTEIGEIIKENAEKLITKCQKMVAKASKEMYHFALDIYVRRNDK